MGTGRLIRHESALRDLEERSESIRQKNPQAALRFIDAAERTFRLLAANPGLGTSYAPNHPALAGLRFFPVDRFRFDLVFYRAIPDGIAVLRVLHGARDLPSILAEAFGLTGESDLVEE